MTLDGSGSFRSSPDGSSSSSIMSKFSNGLFNGVHTPPQVPSGAQLEYLFEDEYKSTGPSWGARICYGAGSTYLSGLAVGGMWGMFDGLKNPIGRGSRRLRINCILNACTARGPFVANNLGMLALLYNLIHGGVVHTRDGKADNLSAVGSAGLAGLIYKSTAGVRPAAVAAGLMAGGMGLFKFAQQQRYI